ncbi:transcriptional regulator [Rhizobium subbaraonis]|uniref:Transcriptional regulator n=1 Tax=Rhizobium subbaraonis TaxID=908946 RepID=A0A285ULY2_9HYPH|nr:helix-turn-helix transcriptional regulator [Rhizobium subbaraonis]SOC41636.1 transcriptional regulator [Rhizobium subbaraonis]
MARPEIEPKTELGRRLREVRSRLKFEEREAFAERLGISKQALANYERGERVPDASVLEAYREQFEINLNWLLTGIGSFFDSAAAGRAGGPDGIDLHLVDELGRIVAIECKSFGRQLHPEQVSVETMKLYNDLLRLVANIHDAEEVQAFLPQIRFAFKKRLEAEQNAPGSGKRSA